MTEVELATAIRAVAPEGLPEALALQVRLFCV
ncbi:Conserved protein of unknown function [Mycobacterium canettii CIPT 140070017]|nr:Conserved protein of unknown function [Mycobacterium canettii CIPT 140070017]